ncbi:MAG: type II toxin-antitoxin system Phd/YefM family antitoxin [Microcoleaceae cyanobacterium]
MPTPNIETEITSDLSEFIGRVMASHEIITLTKQGKKQAVLMSPEAFEYLVGQQKYQHQKLMSPQEFEQQFHQSLVDSGCNSREDIINLVRSVKQELYEERHSSR